jgi:hypothetical protein
MDTKTEELIAALLARRDVEVEQVRAAYNHKIQVLQEADAIAAEYGIPERTTKSVVVEAAAPPQQVEAQSPVVQAVLMDNGRGLVASVIRTALAKMEGPFVMPDVLAEAQKIDPTGGALVNRIAVSSYLSKAKTKGDLEVVQEGRGKIPSIYQKVPKKTV